MKNYNKLLCLAALGTMLVGCPGPAATTDAGADAGMAVDANMMRDTGMTTDTGPGDAGTDAFAGNDSGVALDCTGYCTTITANCTSTNAQYTSMSDCMTQCAAAAWTAGTAGDTSGNTLGCRVYHALFAASSSMPAVHCPHAGFLGGGVCTPFRTDAPVEVAVDYTDPTHPLHPAGYVRVDRMGVPAVATALVGPGESTPALAAQDKNDYNDSNPDGDAAFHSGIPLLTAIGAYHFLLDDDLAAAHLTSCSVAHSVDIGAPAPVPICGVQHLDGSPLTGAGAPVVALILPDTLRVDPTAAPGFPNGRQLSDAVIDPILAALLLNLEPCGGTPTGGECPAITTMTACAADTNCTWNPAGSGSCSPAATSKVGVCAGIPMAGCNPATTGCTWTGTACRPVPCEALPSTAACATQPGCFASTCGTGSSAPRCSLATFASIPLNPPANDVAFETTFPYFAMPH